MEWILFCHFSTFHFSFIPTFFIYTYIYICFCVCFSLSAIFPSSEGSSGNSGLSFFPHPRSHRISKFIKIKFSNVVAKSARQQKYVSPWLEKKRNLEKLAHCLAQGHHFSQWTKTLKLRLEAMKLHPAALFPAPFSMCPALMVSLELAEPFPTSSTSANCPDHAPRGVLQPLLS